MSQEDYNNYSPLTESDIRFINDIKADYPIQQDILYMGMLNFRNSLKNPFLPADGSENSNLKEKERASILQERVEEVIIRTDAGVVSLNRDDKHFMYFLPVVKMMSEFYGAYLPYSKAEAQEWLIDGEIFILNNLLTEHADLSKSQRYQIIGFFLVHFKLNKRVSIKTKSEWLVDPSDRDYKRYLKKLIESRLKSILNRFS